MKARPDDEIPGRVDESSHSAGPAFLPDLNGGQTFGKILRNHRSGKLDLWPAALIYEPSISLLDCLDIGQSARKRPGSAKVMGNYQFSRLLDKTIIDSLPMPENG